MNYYLTVRVKCMATTAMYQKRVLNHNIGRYSVKENSPQNPPYLVKPHSVPFDFQVLVFHLLIGHKYKKHHLNTVFCPSHIEIFLSLHMYNFWSSKKQTKITYDIHGFFSRISKTKFSNRNDINHILTIKVLLVGWAR